MLKIRLARGGAKKRPYYQIVVADSRSPRDGRFIERVGSYNPLLGKDSPDRIKLNTDRIQEWISKGAQPTDRVARFLSVEGLVKWEHGNNPSRGQPGKKAQERAAERTQRETDRAEAEATARAEAAAAAAAPKPVEEEPPVEEPAPEPAAVEEPPVEETPEVEAAPADDAPASEDAPAAEEVALAGEETTPEDPSA